jgi:hypothetical protein
MRPWTFALALAGFVAAEAASAQTRILREEPPVGAMRYGERVLVDDGRCPAGEITEITAARSTSADGEPRRQRRCIVRRPAMRPG